jgi:tetratricopeptide (TPR) repeat protein
MSHQESNTEDDLLISSSNFNDIYKPFTNLSPFFKVNGTELIVDRSEGVKKYEHTPLSRQVESELDKFANSKNYMEIEQKLEEYYSQYNAIVDNSLKYVFMFYKVFFTNKKAIVEFVKRNYEVSERSYKCCFYIFNTDAQLFYNLGLLYTMFFYSSFTRTKRYNEAIAAFDECCRLDPNQAFATNNLAYLLILLKKHKEAADVCKRASLTNKVSKVYFRNWAMALLHLKQYSEAVDVIKRAIEDEPTSACNLLHHSLRQLDDLGRNHDK